MIVFAAAASMWLVCKDAFGLCCTVTLTHTPLVAAADYSKAPDIYYSSMNARLVISGIRDEVRQVADGYLLGKLQSGA